MGVMDELSIERVFAVPEGGGRHVVFLSPHPDDAAFSAAALLDRLSGVPNVWLTIAVLFSQSDFTPPGVAGGGASGASATDQAGRVERVTAIREAEDEAYVGGLAARAMAVGSVVEMVRLDLLDAPLRGYETVAEYQSGAPFTQEDEVQVQRICEVIATRLSKDCTLVSLSGVGDHIDHRITRRAAERLSADHDLGLILCQDMPYSALAMGSTPWPPEGYSETNLLRVTHPNLLEVKARAIDCYPSQIVPSQREAILAHAKAQGAELVLRGGGAGNLPRNGA